LRNYLESSADPIFILNTDTNEAVYKNPEAFKVLSIPASPERSVANFDLSQPIFEISSED
jgi:hypothetical protein